MPHSCDQIAEQKTIAQLLTALQREKLIDPHDHRLKAMTKDPVSLAFFLEKIEPLLTIKSDKKQWQHFTHEIFNQAQNYALSLAHQQKRHKTLKSAAKKHHFTRLCEWINQQDHSIDKTLFFEQWAAFSGHPYHPCHKTKLGFSSAENKKFSAEFQQTVPLVIGALHRDIAYIETSFDHQHYSNWFFSHYPELLARWVFRIELTRCNPNDFIPLPIHPWQAKHTLPVLFKHLIKEKKLLLFKGLLLNTRPTLSFRTMAPTESFSQPHIKLPVAVQATSAIRTVSPASTENGPQITALFKEIFQREKQLKNTLSILQETVGIHVNGFPDNIAKNLSVIFRDNPYRYIAKDELGIVVAALFQPSPVSDKPLCIELMEESGVTDLAGATDYFSHYSQIVLSSYLLLFLKYGIALEGHQQNTIAVFKNGKPVSMIARDFGGLRICLPDIKALGLTIMPYPDSATFSNDRTAVCHKLIHSTYQYHLGAWVECLSAYYQTAAEHFWTVVSHKSEKQFLQLKETLPNSQWLADYQQILKQPWQFKALLRMRLQNLSHEYIYLPIDNPLYMESAHNQAQAI